MVLVEAVSGRDIKTKKIFKHGSLFSLMFQFVVFVFLATGGYLTKVTKCGSEGGVLFSNKQQQPKRVRPYTEQQDRASAEQKIYYSTEQP